MLSFSAYYFSDLWLFVALFVRTVSLVLGIGLYVTLFWFLFSRLRFSRLLLYFLVFASVVGFLTIMEMSVLKASHYAN